MEPPTIPQFTEALGTKRAMLEDLQQQVQELKEGREEKKEIPPLKPLLEKKEEREERERERRTPSFQKPSLEEVRNYLVSKRETRFTAEMFISHYESTGWMVGKNKPMKKWQAAINYWISLRNKDSNQNISNYGQQKPQPRRNESAVERAERERQERLSNLKAAVARKLG
jgi:hypothetical protein